LKDSSGILLAKPPVVSVHEPTRVFSKRLLTVSAGVLARSVLALAVLVVSLLSSSQTSLAMPQIQTTRAVTKTPETARCYAVQVGAYGKRAEALAMLNRLTQRFSYPTTLTPLVTQDDTLWRVRVLTTSKTEALKASERLLQDQGVKAWIIPIPCTTRVNGSSESANHDRNPEGATSSSRALPVLTTPTAGRPATAPPENAQATIVAVENVPAEDRDAPNQKNLNRETASADTMSRAAPDKESAQGSVISGAAFSHRTRRRGKSGSEMIGILAAPEIPDGLDGLKILDITPFGPAARAGLVGGDIIVAIDGIAVTSDETLNTELASRKPGSQVRVTFMHIAWVMEATLTIEPEVPF
jgi:membrane-associated protease RseP (regulator of RpoE activity)